MKVSLYMFPGGDGLSSISPPCLRVDMALRLAGVDYETVYLRSPFEVRRVSSSGRLPVVEFDGRRFCDSIEILDEIERRVPEAGLSPAASEERLRDRLWEHFFNDHVYWLGYYMRWLSPEDHERFVRAMFAKAPLMMRAMAPPMLRRSTRARARLVGISAKTLEEVTRAYERALDMVATGLRGGPFLEGHDSPGRGDLAAASSLSQVGYRDTLPEMQRLARERPVTLEHAGRVFEACSMKVPRWIRDS